mgnify:CR=1 FL=1
MNLFQFFEKEKQLELSADFDEKFVVTDGNIQITVL